MAINRSRQRGAVIVYVVIVLLILIGIIGLAVDWGYMTWTAQKLQTAADSAALAGAQQLGVSQAAARTAAVSYAARNEAGAKAVAINSNPTNDPNGDVVIGKYNLSQKVFTATTASDANAVRVVARRTTGSTSGALPLFFGPIFQKNTAEVARYGIAFSQRETNGPPIVALNLTSNAAFKMQGNPTVDVGLGSIHVNSNNAQAATFGGSFNLYAKGLEVVGNYTGNLPSATTVTRGAAVDAEAWLASRPVPDFTPVKTPNRISSSGTYSPGYYSQGLSLNGGANVVLNPGIYILGGANAFNITSSNVRVTGTEVMFYIVSGTFSTKGGTVLVTPPSIGDYAGIQFFQARNNTNPADFGGNSGVFGGTAAGVNTPAGIMYFPSATIQVSGNSSRYVTRLVADKIDMQGSGKLYAVNDYYGPPSKPAKTYLAE